MVWLSEAKIRRKCKIMLHGYKQFHYLHEKWWYLKTHCWRCWNKIWYFKLWIWQSTTERKEQKSYQMGQVQKSKWTLSRLRVKNSYLIDEGCEGKKAKGTKKRAIKRKLKFEDLKNCLEATQLENIINHLESSHR